MPSAVFGVSSSVWLPEVVPAYAPEDPLPELEPPEELVFAVLDVLPEPELLPELEPLDALPEPEPLELEPPELLEPLPEPPEPEPPEVCPRSTDVLPAPLSSTSSLLEDEPPLPILDVL